VNRFIILAGTAMLLALGACTTSVPTSSTSDGADHMVNTAQGSEKSWLHIERLPFSDKGN
jgi:hypothetical protein